MLRVCYLTFPTATASVWASPEPGHFFFVGFLQISSYFPSCGYLVLQSTGSKVDFCTVCELELLWTSQMIIFLAATSLVCFLCVCVHMYKSRCKIIDKQYADNHTTTWIYIHTCNTEAEKPFPGTALWFHNRSHMTKVERNYIFCCLLSCDIKPRGDLHCIWFLILALNTDKYHRR